MKAPSARKRKHQRKISAHRLMPQAKLVANSYWLLSGSRPAQTPRTASAPVWAAKPASSAQPASLPSRSRLSAKKVK